MNNQEKKFNTTVTVMFPTLGGNFTGLDMTKERIREVQDAVATLKPGDVLFLKKAKNPNAAGRHTYFLEIADPSKFQKKNNDEL